MDVFVYGTLTERKTVEDVVSSYEFVGDAVLEGLKVVSGNYLTLGPAPGSEVEGKLLRTADIRSLDAYEGVESGLYVRVDVPGLTGTSRCTSATRSDSPSPNPSSGPGAGRSRRVSPAISRKNRFRFDLANSVG
nr:gamma-glutamylcyclotransferase family protein [Haladaptatus sp. YSMS36]